MVEDNGGLGTANLAFAGFFITMFDFGDNSEDLNDSVEEKSCDWWIWWRSWGRRSTAGWMNLAGRCCFGFAGDRTEVLNLDTVKNVEVKGAF